MSTAVTVERYCAHCGARLTASAEGCPACGAPAPQRSVLLDRTDPAPVRSRVLATLINVAPLIGLLAGLITAAVLTDLSGWMRWALPGLMLAWCLLVLGWEAATGQGPGRSATRLRVVDERTGRPIGPARTLVRTVTKAGTVIGTLGIASLSYRWDPSGREQTWWDRAAGSRVIAGTGDSFAVFDPAAQTRWTPVPPHHSMTPHQSMTPPPTGAPAQQPGQPAPATPFVPPRPPGPAAPLVPAPPAAGPPESVDEPTTVVKREEIADADRASDEPTGAVGRHELLDTPTSEHPRSMIENADVTVARALPGERAATATLEWDSGARVTVGGLVLIGRDPQPVGAEQVDRRLAVGTESVGVSKTHLSLNITTGGIVVTDRHSTNGVRIERADGEVTVCTPDTPTPVREGEKILFGGRSILVSPTG